LKEGFVDQIVKDILSRQPTGEIPSINRPNYQREKGKERTAGEGKGPFPGDLYTLSMRATVPGDREKPETGESKGDRKGIARGVSPTLSESAVRIRGHALFLGTVAGTTIGYVIPDLNEQLRAHVKAPPTLRAIGVLSSRQGAVAQIMAADEAVKKSNAQIIQVQLARDESGGTGHGTFVLFGAEDVADAIRAVEIGLAATEVFQKNAVIRITGKVETHYSARASTALKRVFRAPLDRPCGVIVGAPAGVGLMLSDTALKAAAVELLSFWGPCSEQSFANEVWLAVTGDSASVKSVLETSKALGISFLEECGG
jgi:ethanolamine utilization microcompartment shell protein EutL